jgi:hypothetical protein
MVQKHKYWRRRGNCRGHVRASSRVLQRHRLSQVRNCNVPRQAQGDVSWKKKEKKVVRTKLWASTAKRLEADSCEGLQVDKKEDLKDKDIARDTKRALKDMDY